MGKITEDVGSFIDNYSGVISGNKTKIEKLLDDYKKKIADGIMNESGAIEV